MSQKQTKQTKQTTQTQPGYLQRAYNGLKNFLWNPYAQIAGAIAATAGLAVAVDRNLIQSDLEDKVADSQSALPAEEPEQTGNDQSGATSGKPEVKHFKDYTLTIYRAGDASFGTPGDPNAPSSDSYGLRVKLEGKDGFVNNWYFESEAGLNVVTAVARVAMRHDDKNDKEAFTSSRDYFVQMATHAQVKSEGTAGVIDSAGTGNLYSWSRKRASELRRR